ARWHFVLHVPDTQLHDRRLSKAAESGAFVPRSRTVRDVLPAARRRSDRSRVGLPAAARAADEDELRSPESLPLHARTGEESADRGWRLDFRGCAFQKSERLEQRRHLARGDLFLRADLL